MCRYLRARLPGRVPASAADRVRATRARVRTRRRLRDASSASRRRSPLFWTPAGRAELRLRCRGSFAARAPSSAGGKCAPGAPGRCRARTCRRRSPWLIDWTRGPDGCSRRPRRCGHGGRRPRELGADQPGDARAAPRRHSRRSAAPTSSTPASGTCSAGRPSRRRRSPPTRSRSQEIRLGRQRPADRLRDGPVGRPRPAARDGRHRRGARAVPLRRARDAGERGDRRRTSPTAGRSRSRSSTPPPAPTRCRGSTTTRARDVETFAGMYVQHVLAARGRHHRSSTTSSKNADRAAARSRSAANARSAAPTSTSASRPCCRSPVAAAASTRSPPTRTGSGICRGRRRPSSSCAATRSRTRSTWTFRAPERRRRGRRLAADAADGKGVALARIDRVGTGRRGQPPTRCAKTSRERPVRPTRHSTRSSSRGMSRKPQEHAVLGPSTASGPTENRPRRTASAPRRDPVSDDPLDDRVARRPPLYRGPTRPDAVSPIRGLLPGDAGYLEQLFVAFEAGHVTEGEWRQLPAIHQKLAGPATTRPSSPLRPARRPRQRRAPHRPAPGRLAGAAGRRAVPAQRGAGSRGTRGRSCWRRMCTDIGASVRRRRRRSARAAILACTVRRSRHTSARACRGAHTSSPAGRGRTGGSSSATGSAVARRSSSTRGVVQAQGGRGAPAQLPDRPAGRGRTADEIRTRLRSTDAADGALTVSTAADRWQASRVDVSEGTAQTYRVALGRLLPRLGNEPSTGSTHRPSLTSSASSTPPA